MFPSSSLPGRNPHAQGRRCGRPFGFSLIELLAVIGIIAILAAVAIPALRGMRDGADVTQAANTVNGILGVARSEALAKSMPVWVAFAEKTSGKDHQLIIATVSSADGTGSLSGGASPLGNPKTLTGVRLSDAIPAYGSRGAPDVQLATAESTETFTMPVAGESVTFEKRILRFSPQGSVTVPTEPATNINVIEIGLQPVAGTQDKAGKNSAAIQINGLTGISRIYRP